MLTFFKFIVVFSETLFSGREKINLNDYCGLLQPILINFAIPMETDGIES